MSIEATTYEELKINNVNKKTAQLTSEVGRYLKKTWGVNFIELTVDGCVYSECDIDEIKNNPELYDVCINLTKYADINLKLSSINAGGAAWRLESSFMQYLTNDKDLTDNVVYRSIDYYDQDCDMEMYLFDSNGLTKPVYNRTAADVADITKWFFYNFEIRVESEDTENETIHEYVLNAFENLAGLAESDFVDTADDYADYGEMLMSGSLIFSAENIHTATEILNNLTQKMAEFENVELAIEAAGISDGENDYNFASVVITNSEDKVITEFARF